MREDVIKRTMDFLWDSLQKSINYEGNSQRSVEYRFEHSLRAANIGKIIAINEGLDVERLVVGCLLHDIGYSQELKTDEDYKNHGRLGAKIARDFLITLGYSDEEVEEICYGIAIHVDDKADFDFPRTPLALSISDADNIDRFDAFRLYEGFHLANYRDLSLSSQEEFIQKRLAGLERLKSYKFATPTANNLWNEKLDYQIEFCLKLKYQIECSKKESLFK